MLTPQDIDNKVFKRELRGYSVDEVEEFMQEVSESYEKLYKENLAAKDRITMLSDAVKQYKAMEDTLQNALNVAQRSGEDVKKNAYSKAELILKDAQAQATDIINNSAQEVAKVTYQYEQMKRSLEVFKAKVVSLLNAQLDILKEYSTVEIEDAILNDAKAVTNDVAEQEVFAAETASKAEAEESKKEQIDEPKSHMFEEEEEAVTAELPQIVANQNGEYVSADMQ